MSHSAEKETYSIIEAIQLWKHYLTCEHLDQITDQKSTVPYAIQE